MAAFARNQRETRLVRGSQRKQGTGDGRGACQPTIVSQGCRAVVRVREAAWEAERGSREECRPACLACALAYK